MARPDVALGSALPAVTGQAVRGPASPLAPHRCNRGKARSHTAQGYRRRITRNRPLAPLARCRNQVRQEELRSAPRVALPVVGRALLWRALPQSDPARIVGA